MLCEIPFVSNHISFALTKIFYQNLSLSSEQLSCCSKACKPRHTSRKLKQHPNAKKGHTKHTLGQPFVGMYYIIFSIKDWCKAFFFYFKFGWLAGEVTINYLNSLFIRSFRQILSHGRCDSSIGLEHCGTVLFLLNFSLRFSFHC